MRIFRVILVAGLISTLAAVPGLAAPDFRILVANTWVGGMLSADGARVAITQASASAGGSIYDVATARGIAGFASTSSIAITLSGDGSIARIDRGGSISEYRDGIETHSTRPWVFTPLALSDDGSIAAGVGYGTNGGVAYRMTGGLNGISEPLGDLAGGGTDTQAFSLSGDGSVVVGYGTSDLGREGFRWDARGLVGLGDLPGGAFRSEARGISRDGSTIVGYGTSETGRQAVRWRDGVAELLGDDLSTGSIGSTAYATSGDGSVVVGDSGGVPFVWSEELGMQDLRVVLRSLGVDVSVFERQGLNLGTAIDVSSDGRTILGQGYSIRPFEPIQPILWLATIPEPSSGLLLAIGLMGLASMRRTGVSSS